MSMGLAVTDYTTLIFDCDGVVLDSNKVKTTAFYRATLPYGEAAAQAMVDYHVANGGVSRYKKFAYFLEQIVPIDAEQQGLDLEGLLQSYASHVLEGLLSCEVAPGLDSLRQQTANARWMIVSGGDQAELRDVFGQRCIAEYFDGGIFGSPDTKDEILSREVANGNIRQPALFVGDSVYDFQAANHAGLDFVFLSDWTEVRGWSDWVQAKGITSLASVGSLLNKTRS